MNEHRRDATETRALKSKEMIYKHCIARRAQIRNGLILYMQPNTHKKLALNDRAIPEGFTVSSPTSCEGIYVMSMLEFLSVDRATEPVGRQWQAAKRLSLGPAEAQVG